MRDTILKRVTIKRENLELALNFAIQARRDLERELDYEGPSALIECWQKAKDALHRGEHIKVED